MHSLCLPSGSRVGKSLDLWNFLTNLMSTTNKTRKIVKLLSVFYFVTRRICHFVHLFNYDEVRVVANRSDSGQNDPTLETNEYGTRQVNNVMKISRCSFTLGAAGSTIHMGT